MIINVAPQASIATTPNRADTGVCPYSKQRHKYARVIIIINY